MFYIFSQFIWNLYLFQIQKTNSSTESESDSDSETQNSVNFIIDSKPENYLNSIKSKQNSKIFSSQLKTGLKVEPHLHNNKTSEETHKLLNQITIKSMNEELSQKKCNKSRFSYLFC
jgi:hypothetical protein